MRTKVTEIILLDNSQYRVVLNKSQFVILSHSLKVFTQNDELRFLRLTE